MALYVNGRKVAGLGKSGKDGEPGAAGKSAFELAQEGGYTGTEADFKEAMKNFGENFVGATGSDVFFYIDSNGNIVPKTAEEMREALEVPATGDNGAVPVDKGGTGATTAAEARQSLGAATTVTLTATVPTSWTASGSYFYKDVTVNGILATDNPVVDIYPGSDNAANVLYSESICKVFRITTSANSIRLWATEAIGTAFPIQIKVVR